MRKALSLALVLLGMFLVGCAKEKPDPTKQPGFVDTSDPSKVMGLPPDPNQAPAQDADKK